MQTYWYHYLPWNDNLDFPQLSVLIHFLANSNGIEDIHLVDISVNFSYLSTDLLILNIVE